MYGTDGDTDTFKKDIHELYDIEEELGSGQFAVVRKIVEKETGDEFAGKYVRKKRTKASRNGMSREDIKREIEILRLVDHEKIIKVHDVYETDREMILVMELLRGGELFDYISKKDFLTEEEAIDFTRQILQGLQHLHSRNIVHLDLKPENILLQNTRRKTIKLVDFGLARVVNENEQVREIMGTPEFVAPEVLNFDTISTATDMWALGVIAYILLSGASPFLGEDNQETFTNIIQVDYQFDEEYFDEISDEAKDFIRKLLVKDPRKRPTAHDSSRHTWVEEEVVDKKKRQRRRTTQICTFNFKRFVARKRWKMAFNKIRAMNLIAKMGIKPPPGFITEIPPMGETNDVISVENNVEEKGCHKEHKKNSSTIHRKKHKHSSPKTNVEKTDSLTLKSMDIDIGEGEAAAGSGAEVVASDTEDVAPAEPAPAEPAPAELAPVEPAPVEPVDYNAMSTREKRRARGQLRHHDIVKSKEEIDAKKTKTEDASDAVENGDVAPMQIEAEEVKEEVIPAATVTSTVTIDHKPVAKSTSGGILKKRDAKPVRIPSTGDNYLVTLNSALFQQKESSPDVHSPHQTEPTKHGILKHKESNSGKLDDEAGFHAAVELAGGRTPPGRDSPVGEVTPSAGEDTEMDSERDAKVIEEKSSESSVPNSKSTVSKDAVSKDGDRMANKSTASFSQTKKPQKGDAAEQQRFSPAPWKTRKSSNENLKPALKSLHGVSKVSLKTNRFLCNDKPSGPKSPPSNNAGGGVTGKAKLFAKENAPAAKNAKLPASKDSAGEELKAVACDINLDDVNSEEVYGRKSGGGMSEEKSSGGVSEEVPGRKSSGGRSEEVPGSKSSGGMSEEKSSGGKSEDAPGRKSSGGRSEDAPGRKSSGGRSEEVPGRKSSGGRSEEVPGIKNSAGRSEEVPGIKSSAGRSEEAPGRKSSGGRSEEVPGRKSSGGRSEEAPGIKSNDEKSTKNKDSKNNDSREAKVTSSFEISKPRAGSRSKPRSGSARDNHGENTTGGVTVRSRSNSKQSSKEAVVVANSSRSDASTEFITEVLGEKQAVLNDENTRSEVKQDLDNAIAVSQSLIEVSGGKDDEDTKNELKNSSTHSLTEFTIRPRQNAEDKKAGGFDVTFTIGPPPKQQQLQEQPRVAAMKSRFASSSSSAIVDQNRVPNGKLLTSSSAIDVTNHTRETTQLTFPTADRNAPAQAQKYTPQRDFSKYIGSDQVAKNRPQLKAMPKSTPNRQPKSVMVKRATGTSDTSSPVTIKGKKATVSTMYVPRKTFGFPTKPGNHIEIVPKSEAGEPPPPSKTNNNDDSKRWSQSSNASDRSASSASSEESAASFSVKMENNVNAEKIANSNRKIENHTNAKLSPRASPVLERKWKATLVLPREPDTPPLARDRDVRIASANVPRKKKFTNVMSMWKDK